MKQARATIRQRIEQGRAVLAWVKGHAAAAMAVALLLIAAAWLVDHDARIKREAELGVMRREVTSEVSALRQRAEVAIKESRASERAIRDLETRRTLLEREASALRARLNSLREEDRLRARPATTPGHNEAAGNATSRPGPARNFGIGDSGLATRGPEFGPPPEGSGPQGGVRDSGQAAQTPKSQISDSRFQSQHLGELAAAGFNDQPSIEGRRSPDLNPGFRIPNPDPRVPSPESRVASPVSCGEQAELQDRLIANCEERAELNRAALEAAKHSARELGEALRAKDVMAARLEEQHRAELRVARGSRLRRFGRALQYVGVGVVVGMAVAL
jgi:hypothetical protein